ncbi:MAG TPA: hypothetical protein VG248_05325 [Caulobacteraceae bacterium]|jgi:hypothetical protein|nr:hypothetical protein [Caulobacteraceae bacterium]
MSDVIDAAPAAELRGPFRTPRNAFQQAKGSIHNDAIASKLGFKGGTVPGSVHMDQFVPLLLQIHGEAWWRRGDISLYFTQATVDAEDVRAVVAPGEQRARLSMFNAAEALICRGTASARAPDSLSEVSRMVVDQRPAARENLRILAAISPGEETAGIPLRLETAKLDEALERLTEPLDLYRREHVLPPSHVVGLAHQARSGALAKAGPGVGLFGALEVRHYQGPLHAGVDYVGRTKLLKLTESPKTESAWYDVVVSDPASGRDLACVSFMIRFMKASSPLWTDA